ncbi:MAG: hypothetical protein PVF91_08715 [Chromatiales bacterium]|jgi:hypothetical protein
MKTSVQELTLPVFTLELSKTETTLSGIDDVVRFLTERVDAHPLARFVAVYDHHAHTRSLESGYVDPSIVAARSIVLCFGLTLPGPASMALRPRSMGVCEFADRFVVTFAEGPMPVANLAMERWAEAIATA